MTDTTEPTLSAFARRDAFAKAHFFSSWRDLYRCTREARLKEIMPRLVSSAEDMRLPIFQALAGKLSGSESAFFVWEFNLMNDDPSRTIGQAFNGQ